MRKQKWEVHRCNSIRTFLYPLSARFGAGTFSILYKKTKKVNDNSDTRRETPFLSTLRNCSVTCLRETHSFLSVVYFANFPLCHEMLVETRLARMLLTYVVENSLYVNVRLEFSIPFNELGNTILFGNNFGFYLSGKL